MIKIARDVNKTVEEVNTIPRLGLNFDIADVEIADPDPTKTSVININTFFLYKHVYFFL